MGGGWLRGLTRRRPGVGDGVGTEGRAGGGGGWQWEWAGKAGGNVRRRKRVIRKIGGGQAKGGLGVGLAGKGTFTGTRTPFRHH